MKTKNEFFLLQVNDALFPIGGYSHSYGLETYIQKGIVHDAAQAMLYLHNKLKYSILSTDLLGVRLAYEYTRDGDLTRLLDFNHLINASKLPSELREASLKMGSRFQKTIQGMNIPYETNLLEQFILNTGSKNIHHSCIYGVFCAALCIEEQETLSHYLYGQTSAIVTTCVKSIPLSQTDGQIILNKTFPLLEQLLDTVMTLDLSVYAQSAPGFDVRSMQHECLYSRIYMS